MASHRPQQDAGLAREPRPARTVSPVDPGTLDQLGALARCQDGVLTRSQVLAAGVSEHELRALLDLATWLPLLRGTYLTQPWRQGRELQRSWARAALLSVPGSVVARSSAAVLHGLRGVPARGAVEVVAERHVRPRGHLVPHRSRLGAADVVDLDGLAVTSPVRTLADLVPALPRLDALAVLDSALATRLVDGHDLARAAQAAAGHRGCRGAADLWALADRRAESPLESRVRLRCVEAGLPPQHLQLEVRDEHGHLLARADLAFDGRPERGDRPLLLEADGRSVHDAPEALHRDRWRQNALVALGYQVLRCTWADTLSPGAVPAMVRAAL